MIASTLTAADYRYLSELVETHSGICVEDGKQYLFEARLASVVRQHGHANINQLVNQLRASVTGAIHREAVEAMTTQETSFFRDGHPFEALRKVILPELIARRSQARRLTIWSAASSTGQEPYSLAILLREHFPSLAHWDVKIIATDLCESVLGRARTGRYNRAEAARGLSAPLLARYFQEDADGFLLREEVRRTVEFRQFNLASPWGSLPEFDLILLRNVLIYFGPAAKRRVLEKTRGYLKPDGYLLLGAAETTLHVDEAYEVVHLERSSFYRIAPPRPLNRAAR